MTPKGVGPGESYLEIGWGVYRAMGCSTQVEESGRHYTGWDGGGEILEAGKPSWALTVCRLLLCSTRPCRGNCLDGLWWWWWWFSCYVQLLWSHGLQPSRLLCPWDFPDKDTGVGCHWTYLCQTHQNVYIMSNFFFFFGILSTSQQSFKKKHLTFCLINHKVIKRKASITVLWVLDGQNISSDLVWGLKQSRKRKDEGVAEGVVLW